MENKELAPREWTEQEKAIIDDYFRRSKRRSVKFAKVKGSPHAIQADPSDPWSQMGMFEALGTVHPGLQRYLADQLFATLQCTDSTGELDRDVLVQSAEAALAILAGIHPRDAMEAILVIQMIGVHNLLMDALKGAIVQGQTLEWKKTYGSCAAKMARIYLDQMEALHEHRGGHHQKMTIEHVHVNEGGQAIVGNIGLKADANGQEHQ